MPENNIQNKLNEGIRFFENKDFSNAEPLFKQVLKTNPANAQAWFYLGSMAFKLQNFDMAIKLMNNAISIDPTYIDAHINLGVAYKKIGNISKSIECYKKAIEINPDNACAYNNLGNVLNENSYTEEAMGYLLKALELNPNFASANFNLGVLHLNKKEMAKAIEYYEKAIACGFGPEGYMNLSVAYIINRDFDNGWKYYEHRFIGYDEPKPEVSRPRPKWDGSSLENKIIYVYHEQGIGDTIQFVRFLRKLNDFGSEKILFKCQKGLEPLLIMSDLGADIICNTIPDELVEFDTYIPLLSLPYYFKTTDQSIPHQDKYLKADINKVILYKQKFFDTKKFKVGIFWQGDRGHNADKKRSWPLEAFYPLFELPDIQFYSLQRGYGIEQLQQLPKKFNIISLGETFNDFSDTAAAIENLDLLITVDTSIAHLAGALGKPVWIILPTTPEWRWFLDETSTVWYKSARLFRPESFHKKYDVMDRILQELSEMHRV